VLFTPHLAPMNRGILATCYARPTGPVTTDELLATLRKAWADEPFVVVVDGSPSTKATLGSNTVHVTARADERTGWVVALAALDNLVKGASGQAVQCANLLRDLPETTGLATAGLYP
jgi:N-acetyl-gamma-glutamyl-phosphate reductase